MSVVVERKYAAAPDRVWVALTDHAEMEKWYFKLTGCRPEVGFEFQFWGGDKNKQWLHLCRVTEVKPGSVIAYTWKYDGQPGESLVRFEIFPEGEETRVKVTHTGLETFPQDVPDFHESNFQKGWTSILDKPLKEHLEKK